MVLYTTCFELCPFRMRVNIIYVFLSIVFYNVSAAPAVTTEFERSFEGYRLWSNAPKRADWARKPDHGRNYWRELAAVVTALEPVSPGWLAGAVFGLPQGDENSNHDTPCWGSEKCQPAIQTIDGIPNTAHIWVNMFPLSDKSLLLHLSYPLDDDFENRYTMAMALAYKKAAIERLWKDDHGDAIINENDTGSGFKAMAALEMFTGLGPEYKEKKDFSTAEDMGKWLDQSLEHDKVISPTLVMSGGGLRPLGSKEGKAYTLLDCRVIPGPSSIVNQVPQDGDKEAFDRAMDREQIYAEMEWLVRLKPEDAKSILDAEGIRSKFPKDDKNIFDTYFGIVA